MTGSACRIDEARASELELAEIRERVDAVLHNQERVACAMADVKSGVATIIACMPPHTHPAGPQPVSAAASWEPVSAAASWEADAGTAAAADFRWEGPAPGSAAAEPGAVQGPLALKAEYGGLARAGPSEVPRPTSPSDSRNGATRKVKRFHKLLAFNEGQANPRLRMFNSSGDPAMQHIRSRLSDSVFGRFEGKLDTAVAVAICLNAFYIALEMDADRDPSAIFDGWACVAYAFSLFFWLEVCCKLRLHGCRKHFCGEDRVLNLLDAAAVFTDTVQIIVSVAAGAASMDGVPAVSLFRLLRIFRIVRLGRLLHSPVFKDLLTMVQTLSTGMATLGWAILLLFLVLYSTSLVCRELLADADDENVGDYFRTVPRALLTLFRCSFGDFSSKTGVPIIEYVMLEYGLVWGIGYSIFVFFVAIGLFNVIAAVFLDSTLTATADMHSKKLEARLADQELWYRRAFVIIKHLVEYAKDCDLPPGALLSESAEKIMYAEVARSDIGHMVNEREVIETLQALDIDPADHRILGDILDYDHTGRLNILEFINGLKRLRGHGLRRSDVLSIDLMVRNLQEKIDGVSREIGAMREQGLEAQRAFRTHLFQSSTSLV